MESIITIFDGIGRRVVECFWVKSTMKGNGDCRLSESAIIDDPMSPARCIGYQPARKCYGIGTVTKKEGDRNTPISAPGIRAPPKIEGIN